MASSCILLAIFSLFQLHFHFVSSSTSQLEALLRFRRSLSDGSLATANWNSSDPSPCSWNGITCQNNLVIAITLPRSKLSGPLSPSLFNISSLRHLNLRSNDLHGAIPPFFGGLGFQSIILGGNSLSGPIPSSIGSLLSLQTLDLSGNRLSGGFPFSLLHCRRLRVLDLAGNGFSGDIPAGIGGAFSLLEMLNLSFNAFSGELPGDLGMLVNLRWSIDLSHNLFSGDVPANLGDLPEKVFIDLSFNDLSGKIPQAGSLATRGPLGFIGNPNLCGPPLKACNSKHKASSPLAAIIAADVAAVALMGIIFFLCYRRATGKRQFSRLVNEETQSKLEFFNKNLQFEIEELLKSSASILGKSRLGILYKVELEEGPIMAVRRIGDGGPQRFREFRAEVEKIAELRHPNVLPQMAYLWSIEEKLLIYDYAPYGNLSAAIHGGAVVAPPLPWRQRMRIMKGIARGLAFIHEFKRRRYVHGDLRPKNVLLGREFEPLIANFGLRQLVQNSAENLAEKLPESLYRAPEAESGERRASQKWDVYSYGVVALEMITGRSPETAMSSAGVGLVRWVELCLEEERNLSKLLDPFLLREEDEEEEAEKEGEEIVGALKIALSCVHARPERRPSMRHVLESLEQL